MYPVSSDCGAYNDQGSTNLSEFGGECEQCPVSTGKPWAGLDIVSSTLTTSSWDGREVESRFPIHLEQHAPIHGAPSDEFGCKACTVPPSESRWAPKGNLEVNWSSQNWSPCCLPDSSCAQQCADVDSGSGQSAGHRDDSKCCDQITNVPGLPFSRKCDSYPENSQATKKFRSEDSNDMRIVDDVHFVSNDLPAPPILHSSLPPPNRCLSPSCLALLHQHACMQREFSPDARRQSISSNSQQDFIPILEKRELYMHLDVRNKPPDNPLETSVQHSHHQHCSIAKVTLPSRISFHSTSSSNQQVSRLASQNNLSSSITNLSATTLNSSKAHQELQGFAMSQSLEDLPGDIRDHILKCKCSCDHLGYGNCSTTSLHQLSSISNGYPNRSVSAISTEGDESSRCIAKHRKRKLVSNEAVIWGTAVAVMLLVALGSVGVAIPLALRSDPKADLTERMRTAELLLRETPLIDGHNDLPWNVRKFMHNQLHAFNFSAELDKMRPWSRSSWSHTDLPRLKKGQVSAQFWVAYVPCESQFLNPVQLIIEQMDLIKRLVGQYPDRLKLASNSLDIKEAFKEGRVASLMGVEGGHAIHNSLGVLRAIHNLGARYLTLTHTCSTAWAQSAGPGNDGHTEPNAPEGLTKFGKTVIKEMNRIGLMVDLSHSSHSTMREALETSEAPVIFSHASVYHLCASPRNIPDDVLKKMSANGGIVMVSFYSHFLTCGKDARVKDVMDHINHIRNMAGVDHVGIGADFDGVNKLPKDLKDVSTYPRLFAELLSDPSWSIEDLKKLAGDNILRVMNEVEEVSIDLQLKGSSPYEDEVPYSQILHPNNCTYTFVKDHGT